jgi:hypothetical protein
MVLTYCSKNTSSRSDIWKLLHINVRVDKLFSYTMLLKIDLYNFYNGDCTFQVFFGGGGRKVLEPVLINSSKEGSVAMILLVL